jgi:hypothetical protein
MQRGFATPFLVIVTAFALGLGGGAGFAQQMPSPMPAPGQAPPPPSVDCGRFQPLQIDTQKKADTVMAAMKAKVDRKQICALMTTFVAAEALTLKFLLDNGTWCGVPAQAVAMSKANHEKSLKFRASACSDDGPHPKAPSLSDAIKTPAVDSAANTKTGRFGTFDSLTGNPLSK